MPAYPPVQLFHSAYDKLKEFNYVKFGENFILASATVFAVIIAILSYTFTAFSLWWLDNGDEVKKRSYNALIFTITTTIELVDVIAAIAIYLKRNIPLWYNIGYKTFDNLYAYFYSIA